MMGLIRKIFIKCVKAVLLCYYALRQPSVSIKDKGIIYGALIYFIFPFDFIHDYLPFAGVADDFVALAWAVSRVLHNITPQVKQKASAKIQVWFKDSFS